MTDPYQQNPSSQPTGVSPTHQYDAGQQYSQPGNYPYPDQNPNYSPYQQSGATSQYPAAPYEPTGYGAGLQQAYYATAAQVSHPNATIIFVLGILGLFQIPIVSIAGWVLAHKARKEVKENPAYKEDGLLTAGFVMSIIGTAFFAIWILIFILYAILIVFAVTSSHP